MNGEINQQRLFGGSILIVSIENTPIGVEYARETLAVFMNTDCN